MKKTILFFIRSYQKLISPYLGFGCRFIPTCSHYAAQAIENKGVLTGLALSLGRLIKCHPFHPGGFDPIE